MKNFVKIISVLFTLTMVTANAADTPSIKKKQTTLGLYLTAVEANNMMKKDESILFIDVRTRAEATFVGVPKSIDAVVPYVSVGDWDEWDAKKKTYKLVPNSGYLSAVQELVDNKKLSKSAKIIVMCRSGSRSSKAANLMAKAGYTNVYSIIDGFEGDKVKSGNNKGQRLVNGWKNAHLPWSYKLDEEKMPTDM